MPIYSSILKTLLDFVVNKYPTGRENQIFTVLTISDVHFIVRH